MVFFHKSVDLFAFAGFVIIFSSLSYYCQRKSMAYLNSFVTTDLQFKDVTNTSNLHFKIMDNECSPTNITISDYECSDIDDYLATLPNMSTCVMFGPDRKCKILLTRMFHFTMRKYYMAGNNTYYVYYDMTCSEDNLNCYIPWLTNNIGNVTIYYSKSTPESFSFNYPYESKYFVVSMIFAVITGIMIFMLSMVIRERCKAKNNDNHTYEPVDTNDTSLDGILTDRSKIPPLTACSDGHSKPVGDYGTSIPRITPVTSSPSK